MGPKITVDAVAYIVLSCYLLLMPIGWVGSVLLAAAIHELGHCMAIWALGWKVYEIRIGCFGAKIETHPMPHRDELLCALSGPATGVLLCLFYRWIPRAAFCALIQTLFNLIPVYPFDGGRAVAAISGMLRENSVAKS